MADIDIACITGGPFETNAFLIADLATARCAVVDPGYDAGEEWGEVLRENGLTLESILLTHGHIDHTSGVGSMLRAFPGTPVFLHPLDEPMLSKTNVMAARMLGLPEFETASATDHLADGDIVRVGGIEFRVIHMPGHTPGQVAFLHGDTMFSGDVLFRGSIGRTDLPGGDPKVMTRTLRDRILTLPDTVRVLSGHGPETTIGRERATNPFLRAVASGGELP